MFTFRMNDAFCLSVVLIKNKIEQKNEICDTSISRWSKFANKWPRRTENFLRINESKES